MDDSVSAADAADAADNAREAAQAIPLAHFAHESDGPNTERRPARAAAYAATEAASAACAALNATPDGASVARYAAEAILAAHTAYVPPEVATYDSAIAADYDRLLGGDLGTFPEPGGPIDASESGPLGTLWPSEVPERYAVGLEHMRIALAGADAPPSAGGASGEPAWLPSFDIYIGPGSASTETIQEVLEALSDLHRAAGGLGLEFKVEGQHVLAKMEVTP
jgi:hypothetical protein